MAFFLIPFDAVCRPRRDDDGDGDDDDDDDDDDDKAQKKTPEE